MRCAESCARDRQAEAAEQLDGCIAVFVHCTLRGAYHQRNSASALDSLQLQKLSGELCAAYEVLRAAEVPPHLVAPHSSSSSSSVGASSTMTATSATQHSAVGHTLFDFVDEDGVMNVIDRSLQGLGRMSVRGVLSTVPPPPPGGL